MTFLFFHYFIIIFYNYYHYYFLSFLIFFFLWLYVPGPQAPLSINLFVINFFIFFPTLTTANFFSLLTCIFHYYCLIVIIFFLLLFSTIFLLGFFSCVVLPFNAIYDINLIYKIQMYDNNNIFFVKLYTNIIPWLKERTLCLLFDPIHVFLFNWIKYL